MSKIFIPNIIITKDFEYIKSFANSGGYTKIGDLPKSRNTVILSNQQNKYITGFSYELGVANESNRNYTMTLEVLDSDGQFQELLLDSGLYSKLLESSMKSVARAGIRQGELKYDPFLLYFMFGIGDSIKDWSDPIRGWVQSANIIYENGVRKYVFQFTCNADNYLLRPAILPDHREINPSYQLNFGVQKMDTVVELGFTTEEKFDYTAFEDAKYKQSQKSFLTWLFTSDDTKQLRKSLENIQERTLQRKIENIQDNVTKILKLYIGTCCNISSDNVIVIIPDITFDQRRLLSKYYGRQTANNYFKDYNTLYRTIFGLDLVKDEEPPAKIAAVNKITKILAGQRDVELELDEKGKTEVSDNLDVVCKLRMIAASPSHNESNSNDVAQMPNWWVPINKIANGIEYFLRSRGENNSINFTVMEEFNIKFLELFKSCGLIQDSESPCIIIGDKTMIEEYVYCNKVGVSGMYTADQLIKYESNLHFSKNDPARILEDKKEQYRTNLLRVAFKQKGNSSFGEDTVLDELSYADGDQQNANDAKSISQIFALTDIPTFTHNYKNSNVISFAVEDNPTFFNAFVGVFGAEQRAAYDAFLTNRSGTDYFSTEQLFSKEELAELKQFAADLLKDFERKKNSKELFNTDFKKLDVPLTPLEKQYLANLYSFEGDLNMQPGQLFDGLEFYKEDQIEQAEKIQKSAYDLATQGGFNQMMTWGNATDFVQLLQQGRQGQSVAGRAKERKAATETLKRENVTYLDLLYQQQLAKKYPHYSAQQIQEATMVMRGIQQGIYAHKETYKIIPPIKYVPAVIGPHADGVRQKIQRYMTSQAFKLSLRTLPFFHLSSLRVIGSYCVFYSRRPTIHGVIGAKEIPDYISGAYYINKVKHVISLNECYSEFELTKFLTPEDQKQGEQR